MRQALHIFAKDVRRFYPEILVSLAVTVLFVKYYPQAWGAPAVGFPRLTWIPGTLTALVPVTWWVLIGRVIHAESLVGERQFWVTRPYRWGSLLAAKCLFIAVFVSVPFTAAQCLLLREAGFHPTKCLPGILFNLAMASVIIILPLMALASVTSGFGKMALVILLLLILAAATAYLASLVPSSGSPDYGVPTLYGTFACSIGAIILWQYAKRRTTVARAMVYVVAVVIAMLGVFWPGDYVVGKVYPARAADRPAALEFAFRTGDDSASAAGIDLEDKREVELSLPITLGPIAPTTAVQVEYARVEIHGEGDVHYQSHWQSETLTWLPGEKDAIVRLKVSRPFFERVKAMPLTLELSLALTTLHIGKPSRMVIQQGEFLTPAGSICARGPDWQGNLSCRSAMRQPPLTLVMTQFSTHDCSGERIKSDGGPGFAWMGTLEDDPADFGITSVWTTAAYLRAGSKTNEIDQQHLCVGSTLVFVPYIAAKRTQETISTRAIGLEHLMTRMVM